MEKKIQLTSDLLSALLQGKKLEMQWMEVGFEGVHKVTIVPPHHGIFITMEQLQKIKNWAYSESAFETWETINKIVNKDKQSPTPVY